MAKWDPERTFVTAQRIFGVVHSFSFFPSFSLTSASLATLSCGGALTACSAARRSGASAHRQRATALLVLRQRTQRVLLANIVG